MFDAILAETVSIVSHSGADVEAYLARPLAPGPYPGVVVIHHMPGYDSSTKEITRRFAVEGYSAVCPNLFHRFAPGASPDDAAAAARAAGGISDAEMLAIVNGAVRHLRTLSNASGAVGVIGYCSGGRQTYVAACRLDVDAAVDCYGGRVVAEADELTEAHPVAPIDMTAELRCPLLGLFGAEDRNPSPAHTARMEEELKNYGKTYEFAIYPGAGHGFFSPDRPGYRVEAAVDGWNQICTWFGRHLGAGR